VIGQSLLVLVLIRYLPLLLQSQSLRSSPPTRFHAKFNLPGQKRRFHLSKSFLFESR
jgi:hypothetical protein